MREAPAHRGKIAAALAALGAAAASFLARSCDDVLPEVAEEAGGIALDAALSAGEPVRGAGLPPPTEADVVVAARATLDPATPLGRPLAGDRATLSLQQAAIGPLLIPAAEPLEAALLTCVGRRRAWCVVVADRGGFDAHRERWYALATSFDGTAAAFVAAFGATLPEDTDALWLEVGPDGAWTVQRP